MLNSFRVGYGVIVATFLLLPILAILPLAFTSSVFLNYPVNGFSLRWFEELAQTAQWRNSITNSLLIGAGATVLSVLLGTLAAVGMRRAQGAFAAAVKVVFLLPMVVPAVVLGVGLQIALSRLGLNSSYIGVILSHAVLCVPFVLVSVGTALQGINVRLEWAAASLGASPLQVFWRVTVPLALPGIVTGAVFAFATSLDEVVITLFVAGPDQRTLARQMFSSLRENISPAIASAAIVLIVGTLAMALLAALLRGRRLA